MSDYYPGLNPSEGPKTLPNIGWRGQGWMPVSEYLPECDTDVLLWADGWPRVYAGYWRHSNEWIGRQCVEYEDGPLPDTDPEYWRYFPRPPLAHERW